MQSRGVASLDGINENITKEVKFELRLNDERYLCEDLWQMYPRRVHSREKGSDVEMQRRKKTNMARLQ